mgnify:CR=1 FL=1
MQGLHQLHDHRIGLYRRADGMAAFAGPEPGLDTGSNCFKETAVLAFGFARRTGQAAKYTRRGNADISPPVKRRIPRQQGRIKRLIIWKIKHHALCIPVAMPTVRPGTGVYSRNWMNNSILK